MEAKAFPSDYFAIESQVVYHGYTADQAIIQVSPRPGSYTIETQDIIDIIRQQGDSIALVLFSGVQYYTGQCFDMKTITAEAKSKVPFLNLFNFTLF